MMGPFQKIALPTLNVRFLNFRQLNRRWPCDICHVVLLFYVPRKARQLYVWKLRILYVDLFDKLWSPFLVTFAELVRNHPNKRETNASVFSARQKVCFGVKNSWLEHQWQQLQHHNRRKPSTGQMLDQKRSFDPDIPKLEIV